MIKKKIIVIYLVLMVVTGLLIYYLYMKPETFSQQTTQPQTTQQITCPQTSTNQLPLSVLSRFFGIGFNIYPANNTNLSNVTNTNLFLIEHIPVVYNNTLGSMYAISSDGQLTIKLRNDQDPTQWWVITQKTDNSSTYSIITPFTANISTSMALQYENGNLALRPYTEPGFESQKWVTSLNKITRGIPVLNYNPASMFTPEFDPYSSTTNISSTSLAQQNSQQVSDVISAIKANIQQYLAQIGSTNNNIPQMSASSLGNKDMPLNINLSLGDTAGGSSLSSFANITGGTTPNDVLSLLDKYENVGDGSVSKQLYNSNDLENILKDGKCSNINLGNYTSNRVASCNCKL